MLPLPLLHYKVFNALPHHKWVQLINPPLDMTCLQQKVARFKAQNHPVGTRSVSIYIYVCTVVASAGLASVTNLHVIALLINHHITRLVHRKSTTCTSKAVTKQQVLSDE